MTRKYGYTIRLDEQTKKWSEGESMHNCIDDECCPDFSCCNPHLQAPKEVRKVFYNAYVKDDDKTINRLLGEFLSHLLESELPDKKVYIVGLDALREELE